MDHFYSNNEYITFSEMYSEKLLWSHYSGSADGTGDEEIVLSSF